MSFIVAGITLTVIAGGYSMYSQYQQGKAQEKMYQAQADQARMEAKVAEERAQQQAELAQDQGKEESKKLRRQQMKFLANQEANLAAMGISGVSTEDIISDTTMIQEQDKATLKWNADMASWEAVTTGSYQAWASNNQAAMADASKYNTKKATQMAMTSTFLNTAATVVGFGAISAGNANKAQQLMTNNSGQFGSATSSSGGYRSIMGSSSGSTWANYKG